MNPAVDVSRDVLSATDTTRPRRGHRASPRRPVVATLALIAAAVTTVALGACAPAAPAASDPSSTASATPIPGTPVGAQARWVLDEINGDETSEGELTERLDPVMFEQMPAADLLGVFDDLRAAAPWTPVAYEGTETQARVTIESAQVTYDMTISVTADDLVNGLFFGPPQPERTPAASWDDLREQIASAPFSATLQVTEVADVADVADVPSGDAGEPSAPVELIGTAEPMPIGSEFKLWVLGAVVEAVAAGELGWETVVTIDAQVRSLPSGELQNRPDGATVTVREAAEMMIAISDNTATDALIRAVGRDAVADAMARMGHREPQLNTPFLTTREAFWLMFGDPALRAMWAGAAGDASARAAVLERIPAGAPDLADAAAATPAWRDGVEWFATPDDVTATHVALQQMAETEAGAPVRDILSANPGIAVGDDWSYVGFKGGSSPGVLAGSWYLERTGAPPVVVTVFAQADDAQTLADPTIVYGWAEDAVALLAAP